MAVIEFRTLGTLDLRRADGSELHSLLAQPKRIALLAYLCLAKPRGFHRRDTVLGLFWPDADQTHARTSLRNALHVLRHSLGETALHTRGDEEIAVNFDAVWCDAVAFEEQTASEEIDGALELYRGDFLSGFFLDDVPAFERWLDGERIGLRATAARAARVAAERRELEGNLTGAISLARRSVELTDTDERAVRRLVELLARVGDRAGALQAYDNFERHLATEFDAEPSAETRTLVDRVRSYPTAPAKVNASKTNTPVDTTPPPGLSVPGYLMERELGRGGTSTVFLARDLKHDRPVAIKILRPDVAAVLGTDRFLSEIAIAARLHHPHILPLLDSGKANGLRYYVMPNVDGESLRSRLRREKFLPIQDAIRIASEVADALAYAHGRGIIHRDIKPDNILLENGHALVTDFGIARAISEAGGQRLTETGLAVGTAAYMSPEQADSAGEIDARTDIYALGCVLYEMLTGDPPFVGSSAQAILARKATEPAPRLRAVRETITPSLESSILKALSRAPADRFSTANEFAHSLATQPPVSRWSMLRPAVKRSIVAATVIVIVASAVGLARENMPIAAGSHVVLKNRKLITNTGHVAFPTISPDGKTLAYMTMQCRTSGCTYSIVLQDVDGSASRQLLDSVSELMRFGLEWSPDRRNLLAYARIKGQQGTFLISTLNGASHLVGTSVYTFWADGDSLITYRPKPQGKFWIFVSGLDGVPRDSFPVQVDAVQLDRIAPVPGSPWIIGAFWVERGIRWVAFDRTGRIGGSLSPRHGWAPPPRTSSDAFWIGARAPGSSLASVIRIPFDGKTGQFGSREDTVYTGSPTSIGITADGQTLVLDEGITEYSIWTMDFRDALLGRLPGKGPLMTATSSFTNELSPDGRKIIVERSAGSGAQGTRWEVLPFEGGEATPLAGTPAAEIWADSISATLKTETPRGTELSLLNVNTGVRRAAFLVPDSVVEAFSALPDDGWVWITDAGVRVHLPGKSVRTLRIPEWYLHVGAIDASRDGERLLFVGRSQARDSVRLSAMSLSDGAVTPLKTVFGGFTAAGFLTDGSILFLVWETGDWLTLYHLRASGETDWKVTIPRPVWAFSVSRDLRRAVVTVRDYRADALMSRVAKQ